MNLVLPRSTSSCCHSLPIVMIFSSQISSFCFTCFLVSLLCLVPYLPLAFLFCFYIPFFLASPSRSLHLLSHSRPSREELPVARVVQELTHILRWSKSWQRSHRWGSFFSFYRRSDSCQHSTQPWARFCWGVVVIKDTLTHTPDDAIQSVRLESVIYNITPLFTTQFTAVNYHILGVFGCCLIFLVQTSVFKMYLWRLSVAGVCLLHCYISPKTY